MAPLSMAILEGRAMLAKRYFAYPNSLDPITRTIQIGLIPITLCAMLSLISVSALLIFITYRLISWRKHYKEYVGYNQYVILIYNLLLADLQQSIAFAISFHWLRISKILAPTAPCFVQAWFLNIGDVASGFFVLAIAVHTWLGVVRGYKLTYGWFVVLILCIWSFALLLTVLGPAMHGNRFFARAGGWCWISVDFEKERLYFHYLWVFIIEFGTIAIYGHIFFHLRGRLRGIINNDTSKLSRATKFMIMYPAVYVLLTLPIAIGRMVSMSGAKLPDSFFAFAGTMLTSCGWIDALLYTLTRRVLLTNNLSGGNISGTNTYGRTVTVVHTNATRPGDDQNFGLRSMNKEIDTARIGTARTVTIVGGSNRISRLVNHNHREREGGRGGPARGRSAAHARGHPDPLRENSPTGSQDSIIKPGPKGIGIVTETNIQVQSTRGSENDSDIIPSRFTSRNRSDTGFSTSSR